MFKTDLNYLPQISKTEYTGNGIKLPKVRGTYRYNLPLSNYSFFKTGGCADIIYNPADIDDLIMFLKGKPQELPVTVIGNLSNTLITDKGVRGVVINLKSLQNIKFSENIVKLGAGVQLSKFIHTCVKHGISCCEYLYMIPGTIGGALYMNAGIPEFEISNVVKVINLIDTATGEISQISADGMSYRCGGIPDGKIITSCTLQTKTADKDHLELLLQKIRDNRIRKQPIGAKTCGSTFKNPPDNVAWKLIKNAGCAGMSVGDAKVSSIHSNFIINNGRATSADILALINNIKQRVYEKTGILLKEEIRIIGEL